MIWVLVGIGVVLIGLGVWQLKNKRLLIGTRWGTSREVKNPGVLLYPISFIEIGVGIFALYLAIMGSQSTEGAVRGRCNLIASEGICVEYRGHGASPVSMEILCSVKPDIRVPCDRQGALGYCILWPEDSASTAYEYVYKHKENRPDNTIEDHKRRCRSKGGVWKDLVSK